MLGKLRNMTSVYISQNGKMLMLYRIGSKVVEPSWCGIGGHFEKEELNDATACALRELSEEINISENDLNNFQMRYVTLRLKNGEIRQTYYFFADLKPYVNVELICAEGVLKWVDYNNIIDKKMPYTAEFVLRHYLEIGKNNNHIYGGIATKNDVVFTKFEEF